MHIREWRGGPFHAELIVAPAGTSLVGHTHDRRHALAVLQGGVADDGRPYAAGQARISPAGDPHFVRFLAASLCLLVTVDDDRWLSGLAERWSGTLPWRGLREIAPALGDLQALVASLMNAIHRAEDVIMASAPPPWLQETRHAIFTGALTPRRNTTAIARDAGVSREHFARAFQRHYGTSFVTFRRHQQVKAACRLLSDRAWPLAEIALASGFADQSHMTRSFVRCLGVTPAAARGHVAPRSTSQSFKPAPAGTAIVQA